MSTEVREEESTVLFSTRTSQGPIVNKSRAKGAEWGYYQWPNHYMAAHKNYPAAHLSMYSLLSTLQPMQYSIAHMYYVG